MKMNKFKWFALIVLAIRLLLLVASNSIVIMSILAIVLILIIFCLFIGIGETFLKSNNEKEGYYAQYGESFGTNADKHEEYLEKKKQYIKDKIANKIM